MNTVKVIALLSLVAAKSVPRHGKNPCDRVRSLIGIGLGIHVGDLLDVDLDLDVGKCNRILDAVVDAKVLDGQNGILSL